MKTKILSAGVIQREFDIEVAGQMVPCVIYAPEHSPRITTLIGMGHGGAQHKKSQNIRRRAVRYASEFGRASVAIDAPGHGARISREEAAVEVEKTAARVRGDPDAPSMGPDAKIRWLDALAAQAVPEWQAALDTVLEMDFLRDVTALGYWGVSMGSTIGVPLLAAETRFECAVLGLAELHPDHSACKAAAQQISVPLRFAFQWDDPIRNRNYGVDLFNAFGSRDKSLHINPGGHGDVPASESESWEIFFARHLDRSAWTCANEE